MIFSKLQLLLKNNSMDHYSYRLKTPVKSFKPSPRFSIINLALKSNLVSDFLPRPNFFNFALDEAA